jgi:ribosomal protein S27E
MSENVNVVEGINLTETGVQCPGCGGTIGVRFDPVNNTLTCPFCGLSTKLAQPGEAPAVEELDFNSAMQRASVNWGKIKKLVECSNCGGQALYDAEQVTGACPFCGSTSVAPAAENTQIMAPAAIIPFAVPRDQAQQCWMNYLNRRHCVAKKAYDSKLENITALYLPFWTFDSYTITSYIDELHYNTGGGNIYSRYFKGVWGHNFDDLVIFASDRIRHPFISRVQKFEFEKALPYSPEYLAGIPAERYTVGLNDAWERAKKLMPRTIEKEIEKYEKKIHGGYPLIPKYAINHYNVKFRYLLAPIYLATYKYGKNTLRVAINGQTGEACGDVPTYLPKMILLFVLLGIVAILLYIGAMFLLRPLLVNGMLLP